MAKEPIKGVFLGIELKENPGVIYPPDKLPEKCIAGLREAVIKNLGKKSAG